MKKRYRTAVCISLIWLIKPFWWLYFGLLFPFHVFGQWFSDYEQKLKKKFKIRKNDLDQKPTGAGIRHKYVP